MNYNELEKLKDINLLFNKFLTANTDLPKPELYQISELIVKAFNERNIKVLRAGEKDIYEQIKHMPVNLMLKLKKEFIEKLNLELEMVELLQLKLVAKIIKKNVIKNDEEYELILNRVEEIYSDSDKIDDIKYLNKLLTNYVKGK